MSNPIVVICSTDASFGGSLTPPPWHADAVGGRPRHHPIRRFNRVIANDALGARRPVPAALAERPLRDQAWDLRRDERQWARCAEDRDRGTPRGAAPPPPPGIRVTYPAVRSG